MGTLRSNKIWICPSCHKKHGGFKQNYCCNDQCPAHKKIITDDPKKSIPANHPPQSQKELF